MRVLTSARRWVLEAAPLLPAIYAMVCAAALLLSMATTKPIEPPPVITQSFAHRWEGVPRVIPLPQRPVQTIPIAPDPPSMPVLEEAPPQARAQVPAPVKVRAPATDICRGKGRVYTRGGKSWRCRR